MNKVQVITTLFAFWFSPLLFAESTIRITNGEWEPFMSEYSYQYGVNSHIISEAFKLEGIKIKWGFFPWIRAFQVAKQGKDWDASATWWPSEKTRKAFYLSKPISNTQFVFFYLKSYEFDWNSIDDLKNIEIGTTLEYDYGKDFMAAIDEHKLSIQSVPKDEQNYQKLLQNRIQIFPNDPIVGYSQIRNSVSPDKAKLITHHPREFEKSTLHLIVSKQSKNAKYFIEKFNSGLKKLEENGQLALLLKDLEAGKYDKQKTKWRELPTTEEAKQHQ